MSLSVLYSRASCGVKAPQVTVEAHLALGSPSLTIVGLPEKVVKESKDRVRSAIMTSGFEFPVRRITVNLAPAELPKEGGRFDLPIALGILAASGQIPSNELLHYEFAGELALSGELHAIRGCLPLALEAAQTGRDLVIPETNAKEASLAPDVSIFAANHLLAVAAHLQRRALLPRYQSEKNFSQLNYPDLKDVLGQPQARRVLEIAASGGHSLLMTGPPGTGKTMLASRLPGLLPEMSVEEACETAAVLSIGHQGLDVQRWRERPFRAPHHSASAVALVGGGNPPKPGEISLAHHGVLFLDELPEFNRQVLETLREPLESGYIMISRAARQARFPANFQLIAAMNPCPCGYRGDSTGNCNCSPDAVRRYQAKISGPFLDRIDMHIQVARQPIAQFMKGDQVPGESSVCVKKRVAKVSARQYQRQNKLNARLNAQELKIHCALSAKNRALLEKQLEQLNLSARGYHRILKVARTLADMQNVAAIEERHLNEAIGYSRRF